MEERQNETITEDLEEDKTWCVYIHTNKINGKVYIGITCRDPIKRWANGKGYPNNTYFNNAIQKYGWENFEHQVLYENLTKTAACQKEIELIKFYDSTNRDVGYNLTLGGDHSPMYKRHHTEEAKRKIGEPKIGKYAGEGNPNYGNHKLVGENSPSYGSGLAVVQFNQDGYRISEYVSSRQAEKSTGVSESNIRLCCKGKIMSAGGFMWRYAKDCNEDKINPYINPKWSPVVQLDLNNNIIQIFNSIKDASIKIKIPSSSISACCKGIMKSVGGFRWMYQEEYKQQFNNANKD